LTVQERIKVMTDLEPKHIICAVRGGAESRDTVTHAIELALEGGARLTFLHVMDAEFLQHATVGPLSVVYSELMEMGRPTRSPGRNVFEAGELNAFVAKLEREGRIRVVQVTPADSGSH
jgi:nucleotide-binding universal stress UspA family protein